MFQKLSVFAAWACLGFIAYATLSCAAARPELTATEATLVVFVERFGAYGLLGFLFCLGYPRRFALICLIVFGSAILLELLQLLTPDRDARLVDAVDKPAGGAAGIFAARALMRWPAALVGTWLPNSLAQCQLAIFRADGLVVPRKFGLGFVRLVAGSDGG